MLSTSPLTSSFASAAEETLSSPRAGVLPPTSCWRSLFPGPRPSDPVFLLRYFRFAPSFQGAAHGALVNLTEKKSSANAARPGGGLRFRRDVVPSRTAVGRGRGGPPPLTARATRSRATRRRQLTRQASSQIPYSRGMRSNTVTIRNFAATSVRRLVHCGSRPLFSCLSRAERSGKWWIEEETEIRDQRLSRKIS